jgi:hypothetical protein
MYVNMYVCTSTCMYIHVCVYICMYEISIYPLYYLYRVVSAQTFQNIEFVYLFECTFMYSTQTLTTVP